MYLTPVSTLASQDMVRGAQADPINNGLLAIDAPHAGASLILENIRAISTVPSSTPSFQSVLGLFRHDPNPTCTAHIGNRQQPLHVHLIGIPDAIMRVECPTASTLRLENTVGECLQTVWTAVDTVVTSGNGSIVVFPDPLALPSVVDVSGMRSFDHQQDPTRVLVYLSQWQQDGQRGGTVEIVGKLPFAAEDPVVVRGCGTHRVKCAVTDKNGRPACRVTEACVASRDAATKALMAELNAFEPCVPQEF